MVWRLQTLEETIIKVEEIDHDEEEVNFFTSDILEGVIYSSRMNEQMTTDHCTEIAHSEETIIKKEDIVHDEEANIASNNLEDEAFLFKYAV